MTYRHCAGGGMENREWRGRTRTYLDADCYVSAAVNAKYGCPHGCFARWYIIEVDDRRAAWIHHLDNRNRGKVGVVARWKYHRGVLIRFGDALVLWCIPRSRKVLDIELIVRMSG